MEKTKFRGLLAEMAKHKDRQKTIAKLLGLSECAVSKRFNGKIEWRIGEVEKICNYYKKDYYQLFVD